MSTNDAQPLKTIGLGGDGDEVDAVQAVERHFRVALDDTNAGNWRTAGDVFSSLLEVLPADQRERDELWPTFAAILCDETGADALRIGPNTLLLGLPLRSTVRSWLVRLFGSRA